MSNQGSQRHFSISCIQPLLWAAVLVQGKRDPGFLTEIAIPMGVDQPFNWTGHLTSLTFDVALKNELCVSVGQENPSPFEERNTAVTALSRKL